MTWNKDLNKVGMELFKKAKPTDLRTLSIGVYGLTNSGKSHFALTAPPPVLVIDTEFGVAPVVIRKESPFIDKKKGGIAEKDKEIQIAEVLVVNEDNDVDLVQSLRLTEEIIEASTKYALEHPDPPGTIVLDTGSELWSWYGLWLESEGASRFTQSGKMMQTEWSKVNKPYTRLMYRLKLCGWNVIITGKAREMYSKGGEPLGIYTGRYQKDTEHWLDVVLEARHLGTHREFRTVKNRLKDTVEVYKNPTWNDIWQSITGKPYVVPPKLTKEVKKDEEKKQ